MGFLGGFFTFIAERQEQLLGLLIEHIQLTAIAVFCAVLIGVPLGILISNYQKLNKPVMGTANIVQAIPSLACLGFLVPFMGIGRNPAIFMVVIYSLLPIVKNTCTGLDNINKETLEAARGIGMTNLQVLTKVQIPLALPVIMAGIRISSVTAVGLMTVAAFIGAGGLGYMVYSGVQMVNNYMILAGAIPACLLALIMDFVVGKVEKAVTPLSMRSDGNIPNSKEQVQKAKKMRKMLFGAIAAGLAAIMIFVLASSVSGAKTVRVTSKYYPEQLILGNMVSDLIEAKTDLTVERKLNMGGTQICLSAMTSGEVDIQVEYTGSMFASVLAQDLSTDADYIYNFVKGEYKSRYDLDVYDSMGFNNQYALAVRRDTAEKYHLETISDIAKVADQLIFTPTIEFSNREDGMVGMNKAYEMAFKEVIPVDGGLRYSSIDSGHCDVIVAYETDALIAKYDLVVLTDDKQFFLPYHAVPIIRADTLAKYPELGEVINSLSGKLTRDIMSELNYQVEIEGKDPSVVAREFLVENKYI